MCLLLREALTVGRISFHKDFHSNEMSDDEARRRVVDEMMNYCVVTEPPKTTLWKIKKNVHRQALWPTRRRRHRSPTGDDRLLQVLCAPHAHALVRVVTDTLCPACAVQDPNTAPSATTITRRRRASPTIHSRRQPLAKL